MIVCPYALPVPLLRKRQCLLLCTLLLCLESKENKLGISPYPPGKIFVGHSTLQTDRSLPNQPPAEGHMGCFQAFVLKDNSAVRSFLPLFCVFVEVCLQHRFLEGVWFGQGQVWYACHFSSCCQTPPWGPHHSSVFLAGCESTFDSNTAWCI